MASLTYAKAIENAAHLIALGDTTVYLYDDKEAFPWDKAVGVVSGSTYRLNGPAGMYILAEEAGLTFKISVDFEKQDANGRGVSLFDRDRLRDVALKLPKSAREEFARMLNTEVLPGMMKRTAEIREALNSQLDSEDCVRGIIAFADTVSA